ncbi:MAG: protoporphyrinogen oxidase, partial [Planctomycetota bacterium]
KIDLFEANPHAGGVIQSERLSGYLCEAGPNGFLDNEPTTLQLIHLLNLQSRLTPASSKSRSRFIVKNKRLIAVTMGPLPFLESSLLPPWSKLRLFFEPWIPSKKKGQEESIESFACRRLGREVARWILDPVVAGIYAGDIKKLSMPASFPKIAQMEEDYGSVVRGLIASRKKTPKQEPPRLHTFLEGMQELPRRLEAELSTEIHCAEPVEHCHWNAQEVILKTTHRRESYDLVVFAVPSYVASSLLGSQFPEIATILAQIRYAPIFTLCHGYPNHASALCRQGFGQLNPTRENLHSLGTLWSSSIFPSQAPDGFFLLRTLFGGDRPGALFQYPEGLKLGLKETQKLLRIQTPPDFSREYRIEKAIAQYEVGHLQKLKKLTEWEKQVPRIFFTGSAYRGVSINSCIKDAFEIAQKIQQQFLLNP